MYRWSESSLKRMTGVRPELIIIANDVLRDARADGILDFTIPAYGGLRTQRIQDKLVQRGVSKTRNSRHLIGRALDVVPWFNGGPSWDLDIQSVREAYEWKWEKWEWYADEHGFPMKPRILWDWPHHEMADP
jgi:peptidoglycan L-alanyl-D-glutamate endopeptidase CwlK